METEKLDSKLTEIKNITAMEKFVADNKDEIVHQKAADFYLECLERHQVTEKELRKAISATLVNGKPVIDRTYIAHYLGLTKSMPRNNLIILAVYGKLTLEELNKFLKYNGERELYPKDARDVLIRFAFNNRDKFENVSVIEFYNSLEEALRNQNMEPLCSKLDNPGTEVKKIDYDAAEPETKYLGTLLDEAASKQELERYCQENEEYILNSDNLKRYRASSYILKCCEEKGVTPQQLVNKIVQTYIIDAEYVYHLLNIRRTSKSIKAFTRDNLLAFCIFAEMDLKQVNRVLKYAGKNELYSKDVRDCYLSFCIIHNYSYEDVELILEKHKLPPLNSNWRE